MVHWSKRGYVIDVKHVKRKYAWASGRSNAKRNGINEIGVGLIRAAMPSVEPRQSQIYTDEQFSKMVTKTRLCGKYATLRNQGARGGIRERSKTVETKWLTACEAAQYLKVKSRTLLQWARERKVPGYRLSGIQRCVWRFLRPELDAMLASSSADSADGRQN